MFEDIKIADNGQFDFLDVVYQLKQAISTSYKRYNKLPERSDNGPIKGEVNGVKTISSEGVFLFLARSRRPEDHALLGQLGYHAWELCMENVELKAKLYSTGIMPEGGAEEAARMVEEYRRAADEAEAERVGSMNSFVGEINEVHDVNKRLGEDMDRQKHEYEDKINELTLDKNILRIGKEKAEKELDELRREVVELRAQVNNAKQPESVSLMQFALEDSYGTFGWISLDKEQGLFIPKYEVEALQQSGLELNL